MALNIYQEQPEKVMSICYNNNEFPLNDNIPMDCFWILFTCQKSFNTWYSWCYEHAVHLVAMLINKSSCIMTGGWQEDGSE